VTTNRQNRNWYAANSTFAIGGVSCSADNFVVAKSSVLRIKFCGKKTRPSQICKTLPAMAGDAANLKLTARIKKTIIK